MFSCAFKHGDILNTYNLRSATIYSSFY